MEDAPYTLNTAEEQQRRLAMLPLPHVKPLTDYVAALRVNLSEQYHIPNFDPGDGGIHARVLFLLEAPGPKAVTSKFVSSNNPDPTAKNLWNLIRNAGIARTDTLIWNIVPWYVGTGEHILPVNSKDIRQALPHLNELLALLPRLEMIVLVGRKAHSAEPQIQQCTPVPIKHTYHMSAQVFNRWPEKKRQTEEDFAAMGKFLNENEMPQLKSSRADAPDTLAPDGAEIRVLLDRPHGANRLSLAEALVKPGERTACVSHQTIEEFWYILKGTGLFHRLTPDGSREETAAVTPGDALLIPTGYRFWVENTGPDDLVFLCCGTPPWPGHYEAIVWVKN